jgi:hypothetical protein
VPLDATSTCPRKGLPQRASSQAPIVKAASNGSLSHTPTDNLGTKSLHSVQHERCTAHVMLSSHTGAHQGWLRATVLPIPQPTCVLHSTVAVYAGSAHTSRAAAHRRICHKGGRDTPHPPRRMLPMPSPPIRRTEAFGWQPNQQTDKQLSCKYRTAASHIGKLPRRVATSAGQRRSVGCRKQNYGPGLILCCGVAHKLKHRW